ncbi:MAG TPA: glycoside hydrolase family 16 protein, partial [Solirubrobacteraceae bacterium]|nr:glycoside hydrolase family 16 protein [Solirubrobacteraceae bacterium]
LVRSAAAQRAPRMAPRLLWSDEFGGPAGTAPDPSKWQAMTGGNGWGNGELEYYTARTSNAFLDGAGDLAITARKETYTGPDGVTRQYTSARLQTLGLFQARYGEVEARIKLPAGQGLWPAFWALGTNIDTAGWPQCGEIDVMENLGSDPFDYYASLHGPAAGGSQSEFGLTTEVHSPTSLAGAFHVYGIRWSPNRIVFTLDGVPRATETPASLAPGQQWVFNRPFFLLLNLAVGGNWPGAPNAGTPWPATMLVDWVRVYS